VATMPKRALLAFDTTNQLLSDMNICFVVFF